MSYVIALDEGTTSTRAVLYNTKTDRIEKVRSVAIKQHYPKPSFVEESATEIYSASYSALMEILEETDVSCVEGIGITNQRESVIAWSKSTQKPLYNAIIWQCRRTSEYCESLEEAGYLPKIAKKTGLKIDPYFSATKMRWLLLNVPEVKSAAEKDDLCLGTIDSFLIFKMTGGKSFVTDYTNASRTMLFNINTLEWDDELLDLFGIKREFLPRVVAPDEQVGEFIYGGKSIKLAGVAGDQQAAAVGQGCFKKGVAKITYGTGMFMLANLGDEFRLSKKGLLTTLGYGKKPLYMFEGSVFNAGSTIQWLRDGLGLFTSSEESEKLALSVKDNGGVYLVPAFTGLGAPYWVSDAKGIITGLTRATTKAHITRAALESMAYSAKDIVDVMKREGDIDLSEIRVDGGASKNDFLMQFQSDVLRVAVDRPTERESTALGAAYLCQIALGMKTIEDIEKIRITEKRFTPSGDQAKYNKYYGEWERAVRRCIYDKR